MLPAAALRTGQEAITLTEIELKLTAAPGDLPALMQALEALGKRTSTTASLLTSTYYDSPDLKLQQRHLTLRVREQGAQYVQTVKSATLWKPISFLVANGKI
jgi:inorganic triphosphatase YgiF